MVAWHRGDIDAAARHADAAAALAEATGVDQPLLTDLRAMVAHARGRWEPHTERELGQVWHLPQLAGQVFDAYLCVTEYVLQSGDPYERLIAFAEDLHRQALQAGARRGQAFSATVLGEAHLLTGRVEAARDRLLEAARLSRQVGATGGEALARARLGEALAALGDTVGARAHLDDAVELSHGSPLAEHLLFLVHAPLLRLEPDADSALALVDAAEILLEDQGRCRFCPVSYTIAAASVCVRAGAGACGGVPGAGTGVHGRVAARYVVAGRVRGARRAGSRAWEERRGRHAAAPRRRGIRERGPAAV
jgi:tetratricopeptide (TPR) repeat protein